jgi:hypothetical protein
MKAEWNTQLVLQLPCHGHLGTARDLEFRHELESIMTDYFAKFPVGKVDGGDIGMGKMSIFMFTSQADWEQVLKALNQVIEAFELPGYAVVARFDPDKDEPVVVYPKDYKGTFSVL